MTPEEFAAYITTEYKNILEEIKNIASSEFVKAYYTVEAYE